MSFPAIRSAWAANSSLASTEMATLDGYVQKCAHSDNAADTILSQWTRGASCTDTFGSGSHLTTSVGSVVTVNGSLVLTGTSMTVGDGSNPYTLEVKGASTLKIDTGATLLLDTSSNVTAKSPIILTGAGAKVTTSGGGTIELANSDYVKLAGGHVGATQVVRYDLASFGVLSGFSLASNGMGLSGGGTGATQFFPLPAFWQGAILTTLKLIFVPNTSHVGLPSNNISAALRYYTPTPGGTPLLGTLGSTATYSPGTLAAYIDGTFHSMVIPCGAPTVDRGTNIFVLQLTDESGTNAISGNVFCCLEATYTIADLRPQ